MILTLLPLFSLLLSCFIMMLGFGLIGLLLPVRMGIEGMGTDTIGLVLSMYAVGMLFGGLYSRVLIIRAGHIRMFAAVAALAAISILACGLSTNAWLWGAMRMLMGFCIACTFAAIDSWLSESATAKTRGRILAANQIVIMGAFFIGQFLLNLADPSSQTLFMVAGMLLALALVPIVMSRKSGPAVADIRSMSMLDLFRLSPLGVVACFFCGLLYSGLLNMLPLFASSNGLSGFDLSLFMASAIFGAFILQIPVGFLSDHFDRRSVLFVLLLITIGACLSVPLLSGLDSRYPLMLAIAITTGIIACIYPMSISETFDKVLQNDMVAAMGGLIAIYALGSIIGPYAASLAMKQFGNNALFQFLAVLETLLVIFVIYRMKVRHALPVEAQEKFVMHGLTGSSSIEIDPRFEYHAPEQPLSEAAAVAVKVAQNNPAAAVRMAVALAESAPQEAAQLAVALNQVEKVDIARLYAAITTAAPELSLDIAEALATASPESTDELVTWLARERPEQLSGILVAIAEAVPEHSMDIIGSAAESFAETHAEDASEIMLDLAETYASHLSEGLEEMRPVDRAATYPEHQAADLYTRLYDVMPEHAADLAYTVAEAMPEAATEVAEAYVHSLIDEPEEETAAEGQENQVTTSDTAEEIAQQEAETLENNERVADAFSDYISHSSESMPDQTIDVAAMMVESRPDLASDVIEQLQAMEGFEERLSSNIEDKPQDSIFPDYEPDPEKPAKP
uniref:MFS transporter n=1 Tax=Marinobacterium profundum TaxID=1714300 RepID=UPI000831B358|nr:MFS transporter [Marinobacterium profundum]